MSAYRILRDAEHRIAEIYHYSFDQWGEAQADLYYQGLLDLFEAIAARRMQWRQIPVEFGIDGYFCRYERHFVYWRTLPEGGIGIVTILHERMQQMDLLRDAFER